MGDELEGLICIYTPNEYQTVVFFETLISFVNFWDCRDFVIFGDFNYVLRGDERWGANGFGVTSKELCFFLTRLSFMIFLFGGFSFTCFGSVRTYPEVGSIDSSFFTVSVRGSLICARRLSFALSLIIFLSWLSLGIFEPPITLSNSSTCGAQILI